MTGRIPASYSFPRTCLAKTSPHTSQQCNLITMAELRSSSKQGGTLPVTALDVRTLGTQQGESQAAPQQMHRNLPSRETLHMFSTDTALLQCIATAMQQALPQNLPPSLGGKRGAGSQTSVLMPCLPCCWYCIAREIFHCLDCTHSLLLVGQTGSGQYVSQRARRGESRPSDCTVLPP